jgi:nicotinamide-nucleotide amidase
MTATKRLTVEIMAVGSELLTPHFQDTNSLYLTERLNELGIEVNYKTVVSDNWDELLLGISQALSRADLVLAIGGLGPTRDDRTREAFAAALERKLVFKKELLRKIKARFQRRGLAMPAVNKKQAYIIDGAQVLENRNGTAPGLWLEMGMKAIVLLPGPPLELKPMFDSAVWPRLQKFRAGYAVRKVLKITGLTESVVETLISDIYPQDSDLNVTILASPGQIELHLTAHSRESQQRAEIKAENLAKKFLARLKSNVFSEQGEELEEVVGKLLRDKNKTVSVAESCSGGFLGHRITNVSGSSDYFLMGVVAYSNEAKTKMLGVRSELLQKHGAVSSQVAKAMAEGIRKISCSTFGLAVTGIAGPTGGTPEKPVGLVYISLAWDKGSEVSKNLFLGKRKSIKFQSTQKALDMLRRHLLQKHKKRKGV